MNHTANGYFSWPDSWLTCNIFVDRLSSTEMIPWLHVVNWMVTKRSKSYILIRVLLKGLEKITELLTITQFPTCHLQKKSLLHQRWINTTTLTSRISIQGRRQQLRAPVKKSFRATTPPRPPARVDRQREKGNKAECIVHKMAAGLPNYSRY